MLQLETKTEEKLLMIFFFCPLLGRVCGIMSVVEVEEGGRKNMYID